MEQSTKQIPSGGVQAVQVHVVWTFAHSSSRSGRFAGPFLDADGPIDPLLVAGCWK
jgi:hypothetical protein